MKIKYTALIILTLLLFYGVAKARPLGGYTPLQVSFKSKDVVYLIYMGSSQFVPVINILNAQKKIIFTEKLPMDSVLNRLYDVSALAPGEYYFEVIENDLRFIKPIVYSKESIVNQELKVDIVPTGPSGRFNMICKGVTNKSVYISISNDIQGLIFEETIDAGKDFSRVYNLAGLDDDVYMFEVSSADKVVSKRIQLDKGKLTLKNKE